MTNNLLIAVIALFSINSLCVLFFKEHRSAQKFSIYISLLSALLAIFLLISKGLILEEQYFLILPIIICNVMANIFTPIYRATPKTFAIVNTITLVTIIILINKNSIFFYLLVFLTLFLTFLISHKDTKIMMVAVVLPILTALFFVNSDILFYLILLAFLGPFPLQSWYLKFFESSNFGIICTFVGFQAIVILIGETIFKTPPGDLLPWMVTISALICSFLAIIQNSGRKALPYLISSQLGFLSFSHLTNSQIMNIGSIYMTFSLIAATCSFISIIAALEIRRGNLSLIAPSGNYESYPKLAFLLLIFGLASSGLPLSVGYIAEDLIFAGSFEKSPILNIIWLISIAVNTILIIKFFLYLCQGRPEKQEGLDVTANQFIMGSVVLLLIFFSSILL